MAWLSNPEAVESILQLEIVLGKPRTPEVAITSRPKRAFRPSYRATRRPKPNASQTDAALVGNA